MSSLLDRQATARRKELSVVSTSRSRNPIGQLGAQRPDKESSINSEPSIVHRGARLPSRERFLDILPETTGVRYAEVHRYRERIRTHSSKDSNVTSPGRCLEDCLSRPLELHLNSERGEEVHLPRQLVARYPLILPHRA